MELIEEAARCNGYEIVAAFEERRCVGAMGYRILSDFVHGRHLYIDDLVVTEDCRSLGIGAQLLEYAERVAREQKCEGMRLCTGIENEPGKRFYAREGWTLRSVAYKKKL